MKHLESSSKFSARLPLFAIAVMVIGVICMVGGVVLAILRIVEPDRTALSVPVTDTPVPIMPTQGFLFEATIAPPPLNPDIDIPIMPIMVVEDVITPITITPTATPSVTQSPTLQPPETPTATVSDTPQPRSSRTPTPSISPTPTITSSPTTTPSATPIVTATPRPTFAPDNIVDPLPIRPSSTPLATAAIPQRIQIPNIDLDAPVVSVGWHTVSIGGQVFSRWDVPDEFAAGWHRSSAYLGQSGNTVLNGHHNVWGHVFGELINVEPGDQLIIYSNGEEFNYTVVQTMILEEENQPISVRIENARWLLPSPDERVTLVTCWPQTNFTHRLVVIALPTDQVERQLRNMPSQNGNNQVPTP